MNHIVHHIETQDPHMVVKTILGLFDTGIYHSDTIMRMRGCKLYPKCVYYYIHDYHILVPHGKIKSIVGGDTDYFYDPREGEFTSTQK
jgi:hypothetical protein